MSFLGLAAILAMIVAILVIPLGWPGLWVMIAVVGAGTLMGEVGAGALLAAVAVAAAAEALEFVIVRNMSLKYGGSNRAFWGALVGGTVGVFVGVPIPLAGPVLAGVLGSFLGAAAVALHESGDVGSATRVGWGVVLARAFAAGVKIAAAFVILAIGGTAWVVR